MHLAYSCDKVYVENKYEALTYRYLKNTSNTEGLSSGEGVAKGIEHRKGAYMKIRDFIEAYGGVDGKQIHFYCLNNCRATKVNIEDLFGTNKYDDILDCQLDQWEFEQGTICIMYFND